MGKKTVPEVLIVTRGQMFRSRVLYSFIKIYFFCAGTVHAYFLQLTTKLRIKIY